jgi:hypothetical protein
MESRFGRDFGAVRIHADRDAAQRAASLGALAYTVGHDIHFAAGSYDLSSDRGRALLAHELAHVVQGDAATASPGGQASTVSSLEGEAQFAAHAVQQGGLVPPIRGVAPSQAVPLRQPTFGDLTGRTPVAGHRVELRQIGGQWFEINLESNARTLATGRYNFVVQDGRTYGSRYGHLEAAAGGRITFAGQIVFSQGGQLDHWNAGSGSYRPAESFAQQAGLPMNRFRVLPPPPEDLLGGRPQPKSVQLPVFQPGAGNQGSGGPRESGQRFQPPAVTKPPAKTESGEVDVPQRGSVTTSGGTTKGVTTAAGEIDVSKKMPGPGAGGFGSTRAAIGWGLAEFAVLQLLNLIIGPILKEQHEQQVALAWARHRPRVQEELNRRQGEIEELLRKTGMKKTIYANVSVDMIVIQACYEGGCTSGFYGLEYVPPVGISTDYIDRRDTFSSIDPAPAGNIIHYPVTFSFAVAEPAALVLRDVWVIHQSLGSVRTKLKAASGGTAGEGVALDYLEVALRATDTAGANEFRNKPGPERYRAMISAMNSCLDFLEGAAKSNPAVKDPLDLLRGTRNLSEYGLGDRWAIIVEAPGH